MALTSDSVNHDNPARDGVAAPSTDYGLKLPVGHEGLSRVGDKSLAPDEQAYPNQPYCWGWESYRFHQMNRFKYEA